MRTQTLDSFTVARLKRFIVDHRKNTAQLPTLRDLSDAGFSKEVVDAALKGKIIVQWYVTLTNGSTVKAFKLPE